MDHFELVDMERWPRAELYRLYTEQWSTVTYSVTKKLSVAGFVPYLKERGIKFVPALMWLVCREINALENYRYAVQDGKLGLWDVVHPMFPNLNTDGNMTFHALHYGPDFRTFYEAYLAEQQENKTKTCLWATKIPVNNFMVSIFPWLHFDGSSMQIKNAKNYYAPFIAIGQYNEQMELPCMLMGNHAVSDAWHVSRFFDGMQKGLEHPEQWCR